jgi:threonine/homoserine/homoserine lactone efflux protein
MSIELWLVYLLAAVGLSLTPGPNGLLALTHGAQFGFRPSVFTILGAGLGFLLIIAISLAGMGALLVASEAAFTTAKWLGAAYLAYLGVRLWRAPAPAFTRIDRDASAHEARAGRLFLEGFLVAASNPKSIIFFAAFLPQFMTPGAPYLIQLAVLGGTFVIIEIVYELMLAGLANRIAPWLLRHGRTFNRITGSTFIGIGAALAAAGR